MARPDALVLGAGPAGLGAALALTRAGARATVVEAGAGVGGLCVTRFTDGFGYDLGGHIPFVRTQGRRAWLEGLLDGELTWVDRPVSCVRGGRLMRGRYLDQAPAAQTPDDLRGTALDWLGRRFPPGVIERVMRPYLEKIDGMALEQMPAGRVQRLAESQSAPEGWWFPLGGVGQLMDRMAEEIAAGGGEIRVGTKALAIDAPGERFEALEVEGADGSERIEAGGLVVGLPVGLAARLLRPTPAPAKPPVMRSVALVILKIARDSLTPEPWIQVDDPRVPFARAYEPRNWSPRMAPEGWTSLGCECYCRGEDDDPVWGLDDAALARACAEALVDPLGLLEDADDASALTVIRLRGAYPAVTVADLPAAMAPAYHLAGIDRLEVAQGSALIEAVEAGEQAAQRIAA